MKSNYVRNQSDPIQVEQITPAKIKKRSLQRSNSNDSQQSKDSKSWYISSGEEMESGSNKVNVNMKVINEPQFSMSPKHQSQASIVIKNIPQSYNQLLDGFLIENDEEFIGKHQSQSSVTSSHFRSISETDSVVIKGSQEQSDSEQSWSEDSDLSLAENQYAQIYRNFKKTSFNSVASKNQGSLTSTCSGGFPQICTAKSSLVETQGQNNQPNQNKSFTSSPYIKENPFIYGSPELIEHAEIQKGVNTKILDSSVTSEISQQKEMSKSARSHEKCSSIHSESSEKYERYMQSIYQHQQKIKQIPINYHFQSDIQSQIQLQTNAQITTTAQTQYTQENDIAFDKHLFTFEKQVQQETAKSEIDSPYVNKHIDFENEQVSLQSPCFLFCPQCQKEVPISVYQEPRQMWKSSFMQILYEVLCCIKQTKTKNQNKAYKCNICNKVLSSVFRRACIQSNIQAGGEKTN